MGHEAAVSTEHIQYEDEIVVCILVRGECQIATSILKNCHHFSGRRHQTAGSDMIPCREKEAAPVITFKI